MTYLASSAGALITDRNTWHTRSDQAWGPSRVWNSGASWEANYGAANSSATTWQGRADQAWGASRVWSSGESWEAAYTRVLPPAAAVVRTNVNAGVSGTSSGTLCTLTTDRAGLWFCSFQGYWNGNSSDSGVSTTLNIAGVGNVDSRSGDAAGSGNAGWPMSLTDSTPRSVGAGGTIMVTYTLGGGTLSGTLYAVFVPTAAAPH